MHSRVERLIGHIGTETRPKLLREAAVGNLPQWTKVIEVKSSADGEEGGVGNVETVVTIDGKTYTNANSTIISSKAAIYIIDGKKCDKEALTKIKPESIASMTVYKAGCKEAVELSGRKDVAVIKVVTK